MEIGASFSYPHLQYLGFDPLKALKDFTALPLSWIRLGCYWNEIEKSKGIYDFKQLDELVSYCQKKNLKILLTVGMKAPRYPEYYLPDWVKEKTDLPRLSIISKSEELLTKSVLEFIEKTVKHYKNNEAIKIWQVENEPLDPSGEKGWRISPEFLQEETGLVRKIDPKRKILINLWGNELSFRKVYKEAIKIADIIGLDLYLHHPVPFFKFFHKLIGPLDSHEKILEICSKIKKQNKEVWITELQAEPWEPSQLTADKNNPKSCLPEHLLKNFQYGQSLNPEVILLWGFEWWYKQKENNDLRYWNEILKLR
jgi:hypothetical protein